MKTKLLHAILFSFFCLAFSLAGNAQWTAVTDSNTMVADLGTSDIQSVGTSDGKTWVVYWHEVPAPQYYEIRCQLLDANGVQIFGPSGMLVNNTVPMSTFTTLWSVTLGEEDNLYIGFNGTGSGNPAYVHKISTTGTQLWGNNGVVVGSGYDVKVLPLHSGEAIVFWLPGNQGVMQKFDASGVAVWSAPVTINPGVAGHKSSAGEMAELSGGDFELLIHDRGGFSPSSFFYAMRYSSTGTNVWTAPVQLANNATVFNRRYNLIQDGDTLWLGYSASPGSDFQGFLQRINPDGTLPWGINGSDFAIQSTYYEMDTKAAFSEGSDYIWAICEYTSTGQNETGEYVQKFNKVTGARQFTTNAKLVFDVTADMQSHKGDLQLVNDKPFFVTSIGYNTGASPLDFVATLLDANGDFAWADTIHDVGTSLYSKFRTNFTTPYNGQSVCVWVEDRVNIGESRAFAQNVQANDCPSPAAGFTYAINGLTVTFTSTALNADTTNWIFSDGGTATGNTIVTYTFPSTGVFTICQNVDNTCGSDVFCDTIYITVIGIPQQGNTATLNVYPNPSQGNLTLAMNLSAPALFSCRISSITGQSLYAYPETRIDGNFSLALTSLGLKPGIYVLDYTLDGKTATKRITVTK